MTLTLLIDLDDTLLGNKMEIFIPAYLHALGEYLVDYVSHEKIVATMLAATQCMFNNNRPDRTLKGVFDPCFFPPLGLDEIGTRELFDQFYAQIFPTLKGKTQFKPEAVEFIEAVLGRGYRVEIATNPVFPRTAILQRLEWAGLPIDKYPFSMIPSYETFHFTKPNPAYFAEFLTRIGWPEEPIIMIGNDPDHDIHGGQEFGIPTFWITKGNDRFPTGVPLPSGSGSLKDVLPWIDSQTVPTLTPDFTSATAMKAILRGSPAALAVMLSEIPSTEWNQRPYPKDWCLTEVICHLRDVEREINLPRLQKIIQEDNPFVPGVDSDTWADERRYISQDGPNAFHAFLTARLETLELLDQIDEKTWTRPLRHAIFGPSDLKEIIKITTGHERIHSRQIFDVIATNNQRN
jgi:FMN phosphatase YigB (HAD superfamily)